MPPCGILAPHTSAICSHLRLHSRRCHTDSYPRRRQRHTAHKNVAALWLPHGVRVKNDGSYFRPYRLGATPFQPPTHQSDHHSRYCHSVRAFRGNVVGRSFQPFQHRQPRGDSGNSRSSRRVRRIPHSAVLRPAHRHLRQRHSLRGPSGRQHQRQPTRPDSLHR